MIIFPEKRSSLIETYAQINNKHLKRIVMEFIRKPEGIDFMKWTVKQQTMKSYILAVILFAVLGWENGYSQTVKFELPAQKGKTLYFLACKGTKRDTIFSGNIDEKGVLLFTPQKDKPVSPGIVSLFIKPDVNFDFI
jgi:hypothetical protein